MLHLNNLKLPIPDLGTMGHGDDGVNTSGYSIGTAAPVRSICGDWFERFFYYKLPITAVLLCSFPLIHIHPGCPPPRTGKPFRVVLFGAPRSLNSIQRKRQIIRTLGWPRGYKVPRVGRPAPVRCRSHLSLTKFSWGGMESF